MITRRLAPEGIARGVVALGVDTSVKVIGTRGLCTCPTDGERTPGLDANIYLKKIGEIHGKTGYFRVTPGTNEENERFLKFVRSYFG